MRIPLMHHGLRDDRPDLVGGLGRQSRQVSPDVQADRPDPVGRAFDQLPDVRLAPVVGGRAVALLQHEPSHLVGEVIEVTDHRRHPFQCIALDQVADSGQLEIGRAHV